MLQSNMLHSLARFEQLAPRSRRFDNLLTLPTITPMALPTAAPERQLKHRRSIDVQIYARGNGLWEVDARLTDVRPEATRRLQGTLPAGVPIHEMLVRLVVDEQFNVVEAGAQTLEMPYPGHCEDYGDIYERLVGLNLLRGFRHAVRERLGGKRACTHITELTQVLPTAVVQAFANNVRTLRVDDSSDERPFQIDGCHALRADGEVVRMYHPRWYRAPADNAASDPAPQLSDH
jgi:hypothetical protein